MSKKFDNFEAVYKFSRDHDFCKNMRANVIAQSGEKIIVSGVLQVHLIEQPGYGDMRVNIMWEELNLEEDQYHSMGLYGYYSSNFCEIVYENGALIIGKNDAVSILITYIADWN